MKNQTPDKPSEKLSARVSMAARVGGFFKKNGYLPDFADPNKWPRGENPKEDESKGG